MVSAGNGAVALMKPKRHIASGAVAQKPHEAARHLCVVPPEARNRESISVPATMFVCRIPLRVLDFKRMGREE